MVATAVEPTLPPSAGHFEAIRAAWDRLRAWDTTHRLATDSAVAAVVLGLCFIPQGFDVYRPWNALLQVALVVPLIWRRRAPFLVLTILSAVALLQWSTTRDLPADVALLIALFTVAVYDTPRRALVGTAVLEVGAIMASIRWVPGGDVRKSLVFLTGMVAAPLFVGMTLRTWRAYMDSLVERTNQLEFERDQQAQLAAAAERSRIAREMHDVVAHNVSIMVTLADGARLVATSDPVRAGEAMEEVAATGRLALTDMRQLVGVLRTDEHSADRQPQPDLAGLPALIDGVRGTGLEVALRQSGRRFDLPPGAALTVYRIVQESLTNVLKHAQRPSRVSVALTFEQPVVEISVRDDGQPSRPRSEGHGLGGMRERAAAYGGTVVVGPAAEGGWEVNARLLVDVGRDPS
jgi:signal transduction histidine kinase